jgi:hypothetical protein
MKASQVRTWLKANDLPKLRQLLLNKRLDVLQSLPHDDFRAEMEPTLWNGFKGYWSMSEDDAIQLACDSFKSIVEMCDLQDQYNS